MMTCEYTSIVQIHFLKLVEIKIRLTIISKKVSLGHVSVLIWYLMLQACANGVQPPYVDLHKSLE
jgi:hypothetical protein